jgi:predicted kinase
VTLYIITGPPCVGKSTWVRERAKTGDIVVDLDRIALAITAEATPHHEYPADIRKAAIMLRQSAVAIAMSYARKGTAYVIHAKPSGRALNKYLRAGAQLIELNAPMDVLMARAKAERPQHIWQTLSRWWDEPEE